MLPDSKKNTDLAGEARRSKGKNRSKLDEKQRKAVEMAKEFHTVKVVLFETLVRSFFEARTYEASVDPRSLQRFMPEFTKFRMDRMQGEYLEGLLHCCLC